VAGSLDYGTVALSNEFSETGSNISIQALRGLHSGRSHVECRKVRLGDVRPDGHLRLDALTRYTQDVSDDDTADAGLEHSLSWVVRRTEVDVVVPAVLGEELIFTTFCSALGRRWAERRLSVKGRQGAHYEVATLWICIDPKSGRPMTLTDQFLSIYGPSAGQRKVSAKLTHPKVFANAEVRRWELRLVDFDVFAHVNNAAYWAVVEHVLSEQQIKPGYRATVEYGSGVGRASHIDVAYAQHSGNQLIWWLNDKAAPAASASVTCLPRGLYSASS